MSTADDQILINSLTLLLIGALTVIFIVVMVIVCIFWLRSLRVGRGSRTVITLNDSRFSTLTISDPRHVTPNCFPWINFSPIRFTLQQLMIATENFRDKLGKGACGSVYKGIFSNGTIVAVKVLYSSSDRRIDEQFKAEVSIIGRVHHINLVRLHGFCFEKNRRALVYEYMANGSLDNYLFRPKNTSILGFQQRHEIAVGIAKGIAYLHEECQQRIIHYDIKPGNILLDANFFPKVADFGLAKLLNRETTHINMSRGRGTPGYAAPEMWEPVPITHKCDVYSFGVLLFEIIGRRRNLDPETEQWFPKLVWKKIEDGEMGELITRVCGGEENYNEMAERMVKVALWCIQHTPESRPLMSVVVKMLEGAVEIPTPLSPFRHLLDVTPNCPPNASSNPFQTGSTFDSEYSSQMVGSGFVCATPVMRKYEIEITTL